MKIPLAIFSLGLVAFFIGTPLFFIGGFANCHWLLYAGFIVATTGVFLTGFSIFLKLAALLFRA